jgi:membrane-bound lytic murein transglycosylase D
LLPQPNAEKFKDNLSKWTRTLSSWTAHKVTAARERIETIAAKFKTTPEVIREANAIPPNMHPKAGSTVLVPKLATTADKDIGQDIADKATLAVESDAPPRRKITVKVGKRDTLMSLSKKYNVTLAEVREWNRLKTDKLTPGQSLKLEVKASKRLQSKSSNRVERPARAERLSISNRAPRANSKSAKSEQATTKLAPAHRRQRAD